MDITELRDYARKVVADHPQHRAEISELYMLALAEIEDGSSETEECEKAKTDIDELIKS
jgi:hypothetical protein